MVKSKSAKKWKSILFNKDTTDMFSMMHSNVNSLNNSKLFAGLMIIILNISSKFVTIKLSKSMESYLKYTFSKQILIFAIAWMGTRDIYIAFGITIIFTICMDYLFNEDSPYCCLPHDFTHYHLKLAESMTTQQQENTSNSGNSPPSPPVTN
jgi:hypothetical protein